VNEGMPPIPFLFPPRPHCGASRFFFRQTTLVKNGHPKNLAYLWALKVMKVPQTSYQQDPG
jgi:hypothetical protein